MVAKVTGALTGMLVTTMRFRLKGTRPVMETAVGFLLGPGGGAFTWHPVDRAVIGRSGDRS